ncbi:unnamed protein product [Durusdinium trenchii]|uniref:Pyruvate kinase n=1 Tax=Durusdinium trenchii TaxID=1381693 RepID=A0ABP0RBR4_9DINO
MLYRHVEARGTGAGSGDRSQSPGVADVTGLGEAARIGSVVRLVKLRCKTVVPCDSAELLSMIFMRLTRILLTLASTSDCHGHDPADPVSLLQRRLRPDTDEVGQRHDAGADDDEDVDDEGEDRAITNLTVSDGRCESLGHRWSTWMPVSPTLLPGVKTRSVDGIKSTWLLETAPKWICLERDETSTSILTDIESLQYAQSCVTKGYGFQSLYLGNAMGPGLCGRWVQRKKVLKTWMTTIEVGTAYKQCIAAAKLSTRLVKVVGHTFDHLLFCQHRRLNNEAQRVKESLPLPEEMTFPKKAIQVSKDLGNTTRRHVFVMGPEGSATRLWTMLLAKGLHLDLRMLNTAHSDHIYNDQAALFHISLPNGGSCKKDFDFSREPLLTDFGGDAAAYAEKAVTTRSLRPMQKLPFFWLDPKELLEKHHQRGDPITVVLVCRDPRALVAMKIFHHCTPMSSC